MWDPQGHLWVFISILHPPQSLMTQGDRVNFLSPNPIRQKISSPNSKPSAARKTSTIMIYELQKLYTESPRHSFPLITYQASSPSYNIMTDIMSRKHDTNPSMVFAIFAALFPLHRSVIWLCSISSYTQNLFRATTHTLSPLESQRQLKEKGGIVGLQFPHHQPHLY